MGIAVAVGRERIRRPSSTIATGAISARSIIVSSRMPNVATRAQRDAPAAKAIGQRSRRQGAEQHADQC
jgi:hypothetical protein